MNLPSITLTVFQCSSLNVTFQASAWEFELEFLSQKRLLANLLLVALTMTKKAD